MLKRFISAQEKAELKRQKQVQKQRDKVKEKAKIKATANNSRYFKTHYCKNKREAILSSQESIANTQESVQQDWGEATRVRNRMRQQENCAGMRQTNLHNFFTSPSPANTNTARDVSLSNTAVTPMRENAMHNHSTTNNEPVPPSNNTNTV